jgi:type II secretory pathway component PulK
MRIDEQNPQQVDRQGERGAALVMVLLLSFLILVAGMALVVTTSLSTTTTVDSTAEMQA